MVPKPAQLERFTRDLDALITPDGRIGIAVSGGPDSLALLLLAIAVRPGKVEAATVDHGLRSESAGEAAAVAALSDRIGIEHRILPVRWAEKPESAIQQRAREERYRLLSQWAEERGLDAVATAHHADDQAETLLMRLARGAGVRGLAGMRPAATVPGSDLPLLRPLLSWRRSELVDICDAAGLQPAADPSNEDEQFERVRMRGALEAAGWLDPQFLAASAAHLGEAETALEWATKREWLNAVDDGDGGIVYRHSDAPAEIRRRIVEAAVDRLATEGAGAQLRGRELDRLIATLASGGQATIRGVRCAGGEQWRFTKAPPRKPSVSG
jgi:tRNA(Ile)-lysidine synthase